METLPSYSDIDGAVTEQDVVAVSSPTPAVRVDRATNAVESPLIGGSGLRIPLSVEARANYDNQVVRQLRSYGALTRINYLLPESSPLRTQVFHPDQFYQSAIGQLDRILQVLASNSLPPTTALRTITLRLRLPAPDSVYVNEARQNGLVQGRDAIKRAFKFWFQKASHAEKVEEAVFEAVDSIAGRITIEGFLILEEWWDLRRGLCMYTIRC